MYVSIYQHALDEGIITREDIQRDGISAYPGTAPCNQVANGLFLRLNGKVQMCPGRSDHFATYGNIYETPIAQIWMQSWNYSLGRKTNNWCTAKTSGMPANITQDIENDLNITSNHDFQFGHEQPHT